MDPIGAYRRLVSLLSFFLGKHAIPIMDIVACVDVFVYRIFFLPLRSNAAPELFLSK